MQACTLGKWLPWAALMVGLLLVAAVRLLPGQTKFVVFAVIPIAAVGLYPMLVSKALKPRPVSVALYVDQSGVYPDDAPLALREDIRQAYIRPPLAARGQRYRNYGGSVPVSFNVQFPDYPMTVELMTRKGQRNIDPGGQDAAAAILTALGFPLTMCAPNYRAPTSRRQWVWTAVVVVLFVGGVLGYSAYMAHRVAGRH
jgi:hypothetical protein